MKINVTLMLFCFNLPLLNAQIPNPFYVDSIDGQYFGVYLPAEYITAVELTKNHSFSLNLNKERSYHDVLMVTEHYIYSDYGFCDQYAIPSGEIQKFKLFTNNNSEIMIRDNNGKLYKKISDDIDNYYNVVSYYIGKIILRELNVKLTGLHISRDDVYIPFLNNQFYKIILYEKGVYVRSNLVLMDENNNWIYLIIENNKYTFYRGETSGSQIIRTNEVIYELER
ncbi:MAG: hypothetical protein LBU85_01180 [Treponema sp.]|nr:hypothetical protein [Treponema sp.]